jgi:hypothetical protein
MRAPPDESEGALAAGVRRATPLGGFGRGCYLGGVTNVRELKNFIP